MAENEVGIDIRARLDRFRQDMAAIPDIGGKEAKALAAQLQKDIRAAERAARAAAKASRDARKESLTAADAFKRAGDAAEAAGSGFGKAAQAAGVLPGPLGQVFQSLADLADGGEVALQMGESLGVSFGTVAAAGGALAVALGGLTAAYYAVEGGIARAAAEAEAYREINASLVPTVRALEDAQLDFLVATNQMTAARAGDEAAALAAERGVRDYAAAQADQRKEIRATIAESEKWLSVVNAILPAQVNLGGAAADAVFGWSASIESANRQLGALDAAVVEEAENQKGLRQVLQDTNQETELQRQADEAARKAKDAHAAAIRRAEEAARAQAEAYRETLRLMDEDTQRTADVAAGIDALRAAADDAADARLAGEAKLRDALGERLAQLEEEYQRTVQMAATDRERLDAAAAYTLARVEAERTALTEIDKLRTDASEKEMERLRDEAAERRRANDAYLGSIGGLYGAIADVASATNDAMTEDQKEAALAAFYIAQAAAAAQAGINTFLGISAALATGNPAGAVAAGIAGAAAEIQILSAPPPKFHSGLEPDEYAATLKRGEAVLSTQGVAAAGGPEAIRAFNAGQAAGGGAAAPMGRIVVVRHKHKVFEAQVEENVRAGGAVARAVARAAGRRGHRRK